MTQWPPGLPLDAVLASLHRHRATMIWHAQARRAAARSARNANIALPKLQSSY